MKASLLTKCLLLASLSCICFTVRQFVDRPCLEAHPVDDEVLGSVVGDGNFFCGSIACTAALGSPTCVWCAIDDYRTVCCDGGTHNCAYSGAVTCGQNTDKMEGTAGTAGTCGVITPCQNPVKNGDCDGVKDAVCT